MNNGQAMAFPIQLVQLPCQVEEIVEPHVKTLGFLASSAGGAHEIEHILKMIGLLRVSCMQRGTEEVSLSCMSEVVQGHLRWGYTWCIWKALQQL